MCGITGFISQNNLSVKTTFRLLQKIQHRGYDGCGFAWIKADKSIRVVKKCGKLDQIEDQIPEDHSFGSLGQVRYKTSGNARSEAEIQPLISSEGNTALVHNGHVHYRHNSENDVGKQNNEYDSAQIMEIVFEKSQPQSFNQLKRTLRILHEKMWGSYSCLALHKTLGLILFRDPRAIRPLSFVYDPKTKTYFASSESISFSDLVNDPVIVDVDPGQVIRIGFDGTVESAYFVDKREVSLHPCLFCHIYLAHPESILDRVLIKQSRIEMGRSMGHLLLKDPKFAAILPSIHVVVPIPKTSCYATKSLADVLKKPFETAIGIRKKGSGNRTFIINGQKNREVAVKKKFYYNAPKLKAKNILLVDDSIVRGTTIRVVAQMIRNRCWSANIYVVSLSPPVISANKFGIDIPDKSLLIAPNNDCDTSKIAEELGVDGVWYHELSSMEQSIMKLNPKINGFETSIFKR
jgi:amidophosphoribosyltransferase